MISVCIASYNGAKYIKDQLLSITKQLGVDDEVVISDDMSTDETRQIIESLNDSRIRIIDGPKKGAMRNFENALMASKGDYIFLSDQDDVWLDGKVDSMMAGLMNYDLVFSDCKIVNTSLEVINESYFSMLPPKLGVINNIAKNHFLGCCMAFNRRVLDYALPFPKGIVMHDIWIGLCASICGKVGIVYKPLMLYRRHDNTVSYAAGTSANSIGYRLYYRAKILQCIINRRLARFKF